MLLVLPTKSFYRKFYTALLKEKGLLTEIGQWPVSPLTLERLFVGVGENSYN